MELKKETDSRHYKVSQYYKSFSDEHKKEGIIYHSILGNGMIASIQLIHLLNNLTGKETFRRDHLSLREDLFNRLLKRKLIVNADFSEDESFCNKLSQNVANQIGHLRLCITDSCNMSCAYCHMNCKKKISNMPLKISIKAIDVYHKLIKQTGKKGKISFFGGEPLLNWKCLKESILYIKELDPSGKYFDPIYVATNGTLINEDIARFFLKTGTTMSISLDGLEGVNDAARKMQNGAESFKHILKGIETIFSIGYDKVSIISVIGDHNIDSISEIISFVAKKGISLSFHNAFAEPKEKSCRASEQKMVDNFFRAELFSREMGVKVEGPWRWPYVKAFATASVPSHCMASGRELSITTSGEIKPCPGFDETMGTIFDINGVFSSPLYKKVSSRKAPCIQECRGCNLEGLCGGGCMVNAGKINGRDVFKRDDSCFLVKSLFKKLMEKHLEALN